MIVKQLSVFLENKQGRLCAAVDVLAKNDINISALSLADTSDFGILRLMVSEVDRAVQVLRDASFAVMLTDVICLNVPNVSGALSEILESLAANDIFIEYMYAFSEGDNANVVIRPTDIDRCVSILTAGNITLLQVL